MALTLGTDSLCTVADVRRMLPQIAGRIAEGNSIVTDSDLEVHITNRFHMMVGAIKKTGVTLSAIDADTTAEAVLKRINTIGAVVDVLLSLGAAVSDQVGGFIDHYSREWNTELKRLGTSFYALGSTSPTKESTTMLPSSMLTGGDNATPAIKLTTELG